MNSVLFHKMSGGGNDFIMFDNRSNQFGDDFPETVRRLCTRGFSIGADGVILIENSKRADFRMAYFNSNGERASFCGNGARCAARFAYMNVIASKQMKMETDAGMVNAEVIDKSVRIEVPGPETVTENVTLDVDGKKITGTFVMAGVPHFIMFVKRVWDFDIIPFSRKIRYHMDFESTGGVNVDFVEKRGKCHLSIRTYERGVESETLSCGSGCIASSVAAAKHYSMPSPIACLTKGGVEFVVEFTDTFRKISLTGDARLVYKGEYRKEALQGFPLETDRNIK